MLFDGDNTLWHVEGLYDRARRELARWLALSGAEANDVEHFQRAEDKRLFEQLGYSAARFATSFENTTRKFVPNATAGQVHFARELAEAVFEHPAELDPDSGTVLGDLKGSYKLALVTAGERWVQERRLRQFPYTDIFDAVRIVERKTAGLFRELTATLGVAMHLSWVVGDSIRSDALPALEAGLNAILIANPNWLEIERDGPPSEHLRVVQRLGDVLGVIAAPARGIPSPARS